MEKKPRVFMWLLLFLILAVFLLVLYQFLATKQSIKIEDIDVSHINLPNEIKCGWYDSELIWDFSTINDEKWISDYVANPNVDIAAFQWTDENSGSVIHLAVVDYKIPIYAQINYFLLDPSKRKKEYYENFQNDSDNIVPPSWTWVNKVANRDSVQCGAGLEEKCYGWFYRAQYGQYYLYIQDNGPSCKDFFEQVVVEINKEFVEIIE